MEEDESPREGYGVPGTTDSQSPEADAFVEAVEEMIDQYGLWGWCIVEVRGAFGPFEGSSYLGESSYKDEEDFKAGGYYEQKQEEALKELQDQIDRAYELIHDGVSS